MSRRRELAPAEPTRFAWWPAIVAGATFLAFLPALSNSFVDWDDLNNLARNAAYRSGFWEALRFAFTSHMGGHYDPLTWLSWSLDYAVWGPRPFGFHFTNVALHAACAAVFFLVARRLLSAAKPQAAGAFLDLGAVFAALVFAVHPLRVESVAWATERKDVLSGLFYLLSVLAYLRERRGSSVLFFVLALLSKISAVTLPAALLVVDAYPLRRKPDWLGKWPYALAAVVPVAGNVVSEAYNNAFPGLSGFGPAARTAATAYGLAFYPLKTLLPFRLAPLYPYPQPFDALQARFLGSAALVLLAVAALWIARKRRPELAAAGVFYAVTLSPMAGFIRSWPQIAADRYSYLPCLSLALLAGAGLTLALERFRSRWPAAAAAAVCLALGAGTWAQCGVWKDTETLWHYELSLQPDCALAHYNLGSFLLSRRDLTQAEAEFRKAIAIDPDYAYAWNDLGNVFCGQRRWAEGLDAYRRAAALMPGYWEAQSNVGLALESLGRVDEAISVFKAAIVVNDRKPGLHENLALAYMTQGRRQDAEAEMAAAEAVGSDPNRIRQLQALLKYVRP